MADISNITVSVEGVDTVCEIKDKVARNDIALNRTTLGIQCKNLFDWKNATYSTSLRLTQTKTESGISVTSTGSWAVTAYKLPILEVGTAYIFSTTISDLSVAGGKAYVVISTSTSSSNIVKAAEITNNGTATIKFEATSNTMYVLFYPNYSDTVYTNSFTASNIMLRYADITDDTYEPYKESVDTRLTKNKSDIAVTKSTLGYQCKNLLKNNAVTKTVSGVTFTINDDKSITVNGTATAQISFMINNKVGLGIGNYILTGCPSGGSWDTFYLTAYASSAWLSAPDFGSGCKIENKTVTQVVISIASGYTANNLKFYPMLRDADITDSTYEPYSDNVDKRLIKNKSDIAINKSTLGYQCKNMLKNTAATKTVSGITFTVNDDKSVTANGTNSTSNYANILVFKGELEAGTYILSGAVSDVFRIRLGLGTSADGYGSYVGVDKGNGYTFTVAEKALYTVTCQVESGKTASNVIFKPMIRDADIMDDTYEEYIEDINTRLNNLLARIEILEGSSS